MNRRDFFSLRSRDGQQIMLLSCQRLYMGYSDARSRLGNDAADYSSSDEDWWAGEPPLAVSSQPVEQLFAELKEEVVQADVLVLEDREWMQDEDFSCQVGQLLNQFRAQGGEIRYSTKNSKKVV